MVKVLNSRDSAVMLNLRARLQGGGGPQDGEVTRLSIRIISHFNLITFTWIGGVTI